MYAFKVHRDIFQHQCFHHITEFNIQANQGRLNKEETALVVMAEEEQGQEVVE